jgi:hypothetical protein
MAEVSLNFGNEYEDDPTVYVGIDVKEPIVDEIPGLFAETQTEGIALEAHLGRLFDLLEDIHKEKGMSQQFALEAVKLDETFLNDNPIGFFSKAPSKTLYRPSLESLYQTVINTVSAAIERIIALIKRFVNWLFRKGKAKVSQHAHSASSQPDEAEIKQLKEAIKETAKETQDVAAFTKPAEAEHDFDKYFKILTDRKQEKTNFAIKEIMDFQDPLFFDIVTNGPYSRLLLHAGGIIDLIHDLFDQRLKAMKEIIREDMSDSGSASTARHNYGATAFLSQPIYLEFNKGQMTIKEIVDEIRVAKETAMANKEEKKMKFTQIFDSLHRAAENPRLIGIVDKVDSMDGKLLELSAGLEKLQDCCRDVFHDGIAGATSTGVGNAIRSLINIVSDEVVNFAMLVHYVFEYVKKIIYYFKTTVGLGKTLMYEIIMIVKKEGKDIPESWEKLKQRLDMVNVAIVSAGWSTYRHQNDIVE